MNAQSTKGSKKIGLPINVDQVFDQIRSTMVNLEGTSQMGASQVCSMFMGLQGLLLEIKQQLSDMQSDKESLENQLSAERRRMDITIEEKRRQKQIKRDNMKLPVAERFNLTVNREHLSIHRECYRKMVPPAKLKKVLKTTPEERRLIRQTRM